MKSTAWIVMLAFALSGCVVAHHETRLAPQSSQVSPAMLKSNAPPPDAPSPPRIDADRVGIVLIDAQPAFWDMMHGESEPIMQRIEQLLVFADITQRPLVATFEDSPERNGWLPERLEKVFPEHGRRIVKRTFDCCREPKVQEVLESLGVEQIVLAGAETDVCVLQSALGLLEMGFEVFLLEDSVFTNEPNPGPALKRMYDAGVVPCTYKTFYFEMTRSVGSAKMRGEWGKRIAELRDVFKSPYALTPTIE